MNGLALGLRYSNQVNVLNPASYSAIDSLTMIFDVGLSGQVTNFKEGGVKLNARNSDFEYAVAAFRIAPKVGLSLGIIPFTNIGYNYSSTSKVGNSTTTSTGTYEGSGGLHQAYLGVGWSFFKNFSIGANLSYLWGSYDKSVSITSNDSYVNTYVKSYSTTVNSYKLDLGLQWEDKIYKDNWLAIGATYGVGHKLGADPELSMSNTDQQTGKTSPTTYTVENGLSIPTTYGIGLSWRHSDRFTIGADYTLQKWGSLDFPTEDVGNNAYVMKSGLLSDRSKIVVGGEYIPNAQSRNLLNRIHYRVGASYATPYFKVNGMDGPKEYSVSAGFGIPIINRMNNRSILNISGQWSHASAKDLITENTFRINIGITFNEQWFMKWKVE